MKHLRNLRVEFKSDARSEWITLRADAPEGDKGLRSIWFVLWRSELESVLSSHHPRTIVDGYHKLAVNGDAWTFYDMDDFPRHCGGTIEVKYRRVIMPRTFVKAIARLARKTWRLQAEARRMPGYESWNEPEVTLRISPEHAARVERLYGYGLGSVDLEMDERTRLFLSECLTANASDTGEGRNLFDMLDRVRCIAVNQTQGFHQRSRVTLSKDLDGFFWQAYAPNSRRSFYHGGIVNHAARENGHNWSIHT